ncbi:MAG TPA: TIGR02996 domain-containing protein [Polyangia bacterium]|jgi:uncharacterized protein (TIGR02996 family)
MKTALAAARAGDWPTCLSALLVAWREARDPPLAELIERVGASIPSEPIPDKDMVNALRARCKSATDADVSTIVEAVVRGVRTLPNRYGILVGLAKARAADPRIAAALAHFVEHPPFQRTDGALYGDITSALDAVDDPRFRPLLVGAWARVEKRLRWIRKHRKDAEILRGVAAAIATREPPEAVDAGALAEIDGLLAVKTPVQKKQARDARELLQAIYDDPLDTSLRLVYADVLLEAGDPRGELIALQCQRGDGPASKRERALLKGYDRKWLGAIEPIVLKSGVEFRRGFVGKAREAAKLIVQNALLAAPEWSTVEELELAVTWGDTAVKFVTDRRWKALRAVWGLSHGDVLAIGRQRDDLPWTSLTIKYWDNALAELSFPALAEVAFLRGMRDVGAVIDALAGRPLAKSLRRVRFDLSFARSLIMQDILQRARDVGIAEVDWAHAWKFEGGEGLILRFAGDRATILAQSAKVDLEVIATFIGQLRPATIRTVGFDLPPRPTLVESGWAIFEQALRAHGVEIPARPQ